MQRLIHPTLIIAALVTLLSCKGKEDPITYQTPERFQGEYSLTSNALFDENPEQTFLMGAIPLAVVEGNESDPELEIFAEKSVDLGFDSLEFITLYFATHRAIDAMRYRLIQSLVTDSTVDGEFVTNLLTRPIQSNILDHMKVNLETTESTTDPAGLHVSLKINQLYAFPECAGLSDPCESQIEIDVSLDFPWPHPEIVTTSNGHMLKLENVTPKINTFKVSNQNASFEMGLDNGYIGKLNTNIPSSSSGAQTRKLDADKIRGDLNFSFINKTQKEDGSDGKVEMSATMVNSFFLMSLMTDFDSGNSTLNVIDSILRLNLTTVELK